MTQRLIYDAEQHIDIDYIESILEKNAGKEIICFGGGTAAEILMRKLLHKYEVACFLDNNVDLQGTKLFEKEICSPEILKDKKQGSYIVLILSKHIDAISSQLKEMGVSESDYVDIYSKFLPYFIIKKYEKNAYDFVDFIERIPDGTFEQIPLKEERRIGVVCLGEMMKNLTWYSMAQSLMLRYNGYRSTLIIDTVKSFFSYIYFDGVEKIAKIYIDYVVDRLKKKCKDIEVLYIDETKSEKLDDQDIEAVRRYTPQVVKWLDSRRDEALLAGKKERFRLAETILKDTLGHIKYFMENHEFDTLNVHTGIHRHRCIYTYLGKKMGIRVSTYDGAETGITLYETNDISGHAYDITKLIMKNPFTKQEKEQIIRLAKENFKQRSNCINKSGGANYQIVDRNQPIVPYDVVIPLNIAWDSAALVRDEIFDSEKEWIEETLEFLMKHTAARVMVREHPAKMVLNQYRFRDYVEEIPILAQYPDRILFADANAEVNTYQYVEACKVVLPYTSTVGVEAAMLKKNVILHTTVYYDSIGIAYKAKDKQDYFRMIERCLKEDSVTTCQNKDNAYFAYYFQMHHVLHTEFSECFTDWMKLSIEQVNDMEGVDTIIGIIAEDNTAIYRNVKENLDK